MDCDVCEVRQRQFFCKNCLRTHLRDFKLSTREAASKRDEQVAKASKGLLEVKPAQERRANVGLMQRRVDELMHGLHTLKQDNEQKRERLRAARERIASRRHTLNTAKQIPLGKDIKVPLSVTTAIARARAVLVQELVEVFNIVEVGGRPPIGGKAGTKGEWTIGDLVLPVPGDIRRYPTDHINAVITHTVHFMGLVTFYLGIKLPFEVQWTGKKLGVGQPWIGAIKGGEAGGWAKHYRKQPLHLTNAPTQDTAASTSAARPSIPITSESYIEPEQEPKTSFITAMTMLLYNVCYLASTQNVDVPLSQTGEVLSNLWSICCSPELGKRSHEAHPYLPQPTPATFALDFAQLHQVTTATPVKKTAHKSRRRSSVKMKERIPEVDEDGWDLVEDASFT